MQTTYSKNINIFHNFTFFTQHYILAQYHQPGEKLFTANAANSENLQPVIQFSSDCYTVQHQATPHHF